MNIIINLSNYHNLLPNKKHHMYLEYLYYGFSEDDDGTMHYDIIKEQFQLP